MAGAAPGSMNDAERESNLEYARESGLVQEMDRLLQEVFKVKPAEFNKFVDKWIGSLESAGNLQEDDEVLKRPVISALACIVCGKDDKPGQQRKSGFKCVDCVGIPSLGRFRVRVETRVEATVTESDEGKRRVNEYEYVKALGQGAYGKVKSVKNLRNGQQYAMKILDKHRLKRARKGLKKSALDDVIQEIRILKNLQHPNVCKMYEVMDDEDKIYLVLEFLSGGQILNLDEDGNAEGEPFHRERLKKYIVAICHGMQYLHQRNVFHRDLKPENILLDKDDNVKLADFGVSSALGEAESDEVSGTAGTLSFMAPEAFGTSRVHGGPVDVWAFGVTLYCMVFRKLPFAATGGYQGLQDAIMQGEPVLDDPDPRVNDLLKLMLDKNPETRVTIEGILSHPLVYDVLSVKGNVVETVRVRVKLTVPTPEEEASVVVPEDGDNAPDEEPPPLDAELEHVDAVLAKQPGRGRGDCGKGVRFLVDWMGREGPDFQLIEPRQGMLAFVSRRSLSTARREFCGA